MTDGKKTDTILILGASGMLGHTLFSQLFHSDRFEVRATARGTELLSRNFPPEMLSNIVGGVDADNFDSIVKVIAEVKPDCVVNCIGIIKQLAASTEHIPALSVNSLFPHRLAMLCRAAGSRLIHISSDCVFDGSKGNYLEADTANATDLYGRTKFLGEVASCPHCITLRTSIIGHELGTRYGLVEWFLSQTAEACGFTGATFSGLPTVVLADILINQVIPDLKLQGLYHVSSDPITKYDLLRMIAQQYGVPTKITPCDNFIADRSLDSRRFREATGYLAPSWDEMTRRMHQDFITAKHYKERY